MKIGHTCPKQMFIVCLKFIYPYELNFICQSPSPTTEYTRILQSFWESTELYILGIYIKIGSRKLLYLKFRATQVYSLTYKWKEASLGCIGFILIYIKKFIALYIHTLFKNLLFSITKQNFLSVWSRFYSVGL